ncbi:GNAT family N-acetyltransferase [Metabacillus sp. HB246100]
MVYIETERVRLRRWKEEDLEPFGQLNADQEVMRYFPSTLSKEETKAFQRVIQKEFDEYGYGLYAVEEKDSQAFIGFIGFHRATFEADFTPCIEIGWRLKKEVWGKGYATEGARACLKFGFDELGFQDVYSFTTERNEPSKRVMNKLGMSFVKRFNHPRMEKTHPLSEHVLYQLSSKKFKNE